MKKVKNEFIDEYLETNNYEVLGYTGDSFIFKDTEEDCLVIAKIELCFGEFQDIIKTNEMRSSLELMMIKFLMNTNYPSSPVRFDIIYLLQTNKHSAVIKHVSNAFNEEE